MASRIAESLQRLVRQPSVSARGEGIEECALLVSGMLEEAGISSKILRIGGAAPMVFGRVESRSNPRKTLLLYNHYDVQPAEPLELWRDPPFAGVKRGRKVFGRGSSDDKGELVARIEAVRRHLEEEGDIPCNVVFAVEGEEEIGSPNVERYLRKYRRRLACDGVIWEFGYVDTRDRPIIGLGMKGLLFVELRVREAVRDAHSGMAVLIRNPAWRLNEALSTLRSPDGRVKVRGWYREVPPLTREQRMLAAREPLDLAAFRKEYGIRKLVGGMGARRAREAMVAGATCNIAGMWSGYTGEGAKTVLPGFAAAKLDFRLVPGMDPARQLGRLRAHLRAGGFGDVEVVPFHSVAPSRTDPSDPLVSCVKRAADRHFGGSVVSLSSTGTGPMDSFSRVLKAPCVSFGCTHVFARIHSPNEFARLDLVEKAARALRGAMSEFARA